jgi:hypothetical protein
MKAIAILPEGDDAHPTAFRAVIAGRKADGRTPGEALDALTSQIGAEKDGAAVIVQLFQPDSYFTAEQRERLSGLMARWRTEREAGSTLPPAEQAELERLVEEELQGSAERAAQMSRELETTGELHHRADEKWVGWQARPEVGRSSRRSFLLYLVGILTLTDLLILLGTGFGFLKWPSALLVICCILNVGLQVFILWSAFRYNRLAERLDAGEALDGSSEDAADSAKQREQARAR